MYKKSRSPFDPSIEFSVENQGAHVFSRQKPGTFRQGVKTIYTSDPTPIIHSRYVRMAFDHMALDESARQALLAKAGLDEQLIDTEDYFLTQKELEALIQIFLKDAHISPSHLGLIIGARFNFNVHGPLGLACMSSETYGEAVELMCRYFHLSMGYYEAKWSVDHGQYSVTLLETTPPKKQHSIGSTLRPASHFFLNDSIYSRRKNYRIPEPNLNLSSTGTA